MSGNASCQHLHTFCAFAAASASSYSSFVMQLLSGSFLSVCLRRSHPLQSNLRGATKWPRWSLNSWQAGQRNGMMASETGGRSGVQLIYFFMKTSNLSSLKESRWGMSTMNEREAGLLVSRLVAGCYIAYHRSASCCCRVVLQQVSLQHAQ